MRNAASALVTSFLVIAAGCTAEPSTPTNSTATATCSTCNVESQPLDFSTAPAINENQNLDLSHAVDFAYAEPLDLAKTTLPAQTPDMAQAATDPGGGGSTSGGGGSNSGGGNDGPATCWSYSFLQYFEQDECEQSASGSWYQCSYDGTWQPVYDDGTGNYYGPDGYCSDYTPFY